MNERQKSVSIMCMVGREVKKTKRGPNRLYNLEKAGVQNLVLRPFDKRLRVI